MLSYKNTKFLFYRFNDLLNQSGHSIKVIKHSAVTDDYIAAEEKSESKLAIFYKTGFGSLQRQRNQ